MVKFNLNENSMLFSELSKSNPDWWDNLKNDKEIYIDIRKDNYINCYYHGGSIIKLKYAKGFKGDISFEYIPLDSKNALVNYNFNSKDILINEQDLQISKIENFSSHWLKKVKKRIARFNPSSSEKAIQADYVLKNNNIIDTELQIDDSRLDMVCISNLRIYFIELKTIGDSRIYFDETVKTDEGKIHEQMCRYHKILNKYEKDLLDHYRKLIRIKYKLGILRNADIIKIIDKLSIETKPILLVGDCTNKWINDNAPNINERISKYSYGAIYHGRNTTNFDIPKRNKNHEFVFNA